MRFKGLSIYFLNQIEEETWKSCLTNTINVLNINVDGEIKERVSKLSFLLEFDGKR